MSNKARETCYEYFDCKEVDCTRREYPEMNCWDIDDDNCYCHSDGFSKLREQLVSKLEACKLCVYYQLNNGKG